MKKTKELQLLTVDQENTSKNNIFQSMSLSELLATLALILELETLHKDPIYQNKENQYLH